MVIDQAGEIRTGEALAVERLEAYLREHWDGFSGLTEVRQFPGGYSNLTYLLATNLGEIVLRRPPFGANIQGGHDMGREFRVLSLLKPVYAKIPAPVLFCDDLEVLGAPFYLMQRVRGIILRGAGMKELAPDIETMRLVSLAAVDNLVQLHRIDVGSTELASLGKPEGYIERQVKGWIDRYFKAQTDNIESMAAIAAWMPDHQPPEGRPTLIHNDYKYDNLVLHPNNWSEVVAVLDWEMATIGEPLMDLGTTLAYWTEAQEAQINMLAASNPTWLPGNLNRREVVERYAQQSGRDVSNILFFYVFGAFKIGVIAQQIYARFKKGHTRDSRFAALIDAVRFFGDRARVALDSNKISGL